MAERKKLSLGAVASERSSSPGDRTRSWNISPSRQAALKDRARAMRRHPSEAQALLWERLKDKQCGFTFNREVVMGSAIVDFACKTRWLVVETGDLGDEAAATLAALSDRKLKEVGVRVLRFSDDQVRDSIEDVVRAIKQELQQPFERPRTQANGSFDERSSERNYAENR